MHYIDHVTVKSSIMLQLIFVNGSLKNSLLNRLNILIIKESIKKIKNCCRNVKRKKQLSTSITFDRNIVSYVKTGVMADEKFSFASQK